jgi:peptidoglycan/LPS O-acetylase OafA/YrhL
MLQKSFITNYRPDVDGLRALAVVAVVIFHAFPSLLPGGFVGVDIFFVLSGYLITGLLLRESAEGTLKLSTFYARRIKRIFPALLVVLISCLGAGWIVFTATEYASLGKYAAGGAAFLNNFLFWKVAGYFDSAADTKPLLHLWSLAIEEQFYIIWPLVIMGICRWSKFKIETLYFLFISSLLYSLWTVNTDLVKDFYSPLTRFWELIIGAILAYKLNYNYIVECKYKKYAAPLGLLLILTSFLIIKKEYNFPGYWALLPTIGTVLIIYSGNKSWVNNTILANPIFVWFGLISYPLYLWHWPLLSFNRIINSETSSALSGAIIITVSILLAWLTYRFIERPIRFNKNLKNVCAILCILMIMIIFLGHGINENKGFQFRNYSTLTLDQNTMVNGADRTKIRKSCAMAPDKNHFVEWCLSDERPAAKNHYAVLGDSKAESLFFGLTRESSSEHSWRMLGPISHLSDQTTPINKAVYESIEQDDRIKTILFVNALRGLFPLNPKTGFIEKTISTREIGMKVASYTKVIKRLSKNNVKFVFVVDHPTLKDPNSCVSGGLTSSVFLNKFIFRKADPHCQVSYTDHLKGTLPYRVFIDALRQENPALIIFDPAYLLCDVAENICKISENRNFLYSYGDHISDYASSKIAKHLLMMVLISTNE